MENFQQRSPSGLPQLIYIDILWVSELFCIVFLTSFSLYATYLLPLQYCDLIHRCAAHLGKWERLDRLTIATIGSNGGSSNCCYNSTSSSSGSSCSSSSSSGSSSSNSSSCIGAIGGGDGSSTQTTNSAAINTAYSE